jgi:peptide/nickel transport system substrate-binding protein
MNREEISQILYHGLLEPAAYGYAPASPYFSEEAAQRYAAYDPDLSRQLLDEAGFVDADGDGVRELDDGSPFTLTVNVIPGMGVDVCQLVADHWGAVGIKVILNVGLRDILVPQLQSGDFEVHWWWSTADDALVKRELWGILGPNQPDWHREAATDGPDWFFESTRLLEEAGTTIDTALVTSHMHRIREIYTEQMPRLIPGFAYHVWGASTRLGNVPEESTTSDPYRGWSRPVFHEQIFIRE